MSDNFDIEAYLEEQVSTNKPTSEKAEKRDGEDAPLGKDDRKSEDRDKRHRSRSRDRRRRDSRDRSRSRGRRDRYRGDSRDRDRGRDRDRRGRDTRDRSRENKDRDRERGAGDAGKDKERENKDRENSDRDRNRSWDRDNKTKYEPPIAAEPSVDREALRKQREIDDLTKDQRTVFVSQLTAKVTEEHLRQFFDQLGKVKGVIMIRDKITNRHKGFAYVEMQELEVIPSCLLFNNIVPDFQKFPILVKASEAEKNFNAKKETDASTLLGKGGAGPGIAGGPDCRLYIGNIHISITEGALRTVLEQFGPVESVVLHKDEMGNSKGYAFIRFAVGESAALAMASLGGLELAGRALKVGPVNDQPANRGAGAASGAAGLATANWKLDDDDGAKGMQMNSQSRAMLMAKLGQSAGLQVPIPPAPPLGAPLPPPAAVPVAAKIAGDPTTCFMICNMFDLSEETGDDWDSDIRDDVSEECSKFGRVLSCYVEKRKPGGLVYMMFDTVQTSMAAGANLHGRFFAGRMITVTYFDPSMYNALIA